jgi:hypothetical protein
VMSWTQNPTSGFLTPRDFSNREGFQQKPYPTQIGNRFLD